MPAWWKTEEERRELKGRAAAILKHEEHKKPQPGHEPLPDDVPDPDDPDQKGGKP